MGEKSYLLVAFDTDSVEGYETERKPTTLKWVYDRFAGLRTRQAAQAMVVLFVSGNFANPQLLAVLSLDH